MQFPEADDEDGDFMTHGSSRSRLSSLFHSESSSGNVNQALTFTAPKQPKKNGAIETGNRQITDCFLSSNDKHAVSIAPEEEVYYLLNPLKYNPQTSSAAMKLLHAVVVHAYKLKESNYSNQGKLGCAILGHHETSSYKLLLYKGKQVQVTVATITSSFIFHVQPNNYANFYDEKKENWSINFDSEGAIFDFSKQIALAKANSQGKSPTTLVIQDLMNGEGQPLEIGDTAEMKYTGWLLINFSFGQSFDSNMNSESLCRLKLGKNKVIKGWNEGLLGMQKGSKRLLIIPPELAYGSEGISNVPPNSTLIYEIHIMKVKFACESSHSPSPVKTTEAIKPDVPPRQSFSQEDNIKMRGASISEQLTQSPKKNKAQLISRMAKMGTATLPFQGAVPAQVSSDSDSEVEVPQPSSPALQNVSRTSSPKPATKPRSRTHSGSIVSNQPPTMQNAVAFQAHNQPTSQAPLYDPSVMSAQSPIICAATPFPGYQPQLPSQYSMLQSSFSMQNVPTMVPSVSTSMVDTHLPLLITEARNQNTEVRISLSKITDKVDTILNKVDDLRSQNRSVNSHIPFMEGATLLQNIERIVQENTRLKEEADTKDSKIQFLNEKVYDLYQRNQRFLEESNTILEQKSDSLQGASAQSQEKIHNLEQEKATLQLELSTITIKLNTLEENLIKYQKIESELHEKLSTTEEEAKKKENLLIETKTQLTGAQSQLNLLTEKIKNVEEEKSLLLQKIDNLEHNLNNSQESTNLVDMYKKETQNYKERIEQLESSVKDSNLSVTKSIDEKEKIKLELNESIQLKNDMEMQLKELQQKLDSSEEFKTSLKEKIKKLEIEVENNKMLKRKYEVFQEKTRALKEKYDKQIVELMNEIKYLQSVKAAGTSPEFSVEIKKVMNLLYKRLQGKFDCVTSYSGAKILETVLQTIMGLTLQILEKKTQSPNDHSSSLEIPEKENILKEEQANLEKTPQTELSQHNGMQVKEIKSSNEHSNNSFSMKENEAEETAGVNKEINIPSSEDRNKPMVEDNHELNENDNIGNNSKPENESKEQIAKPESPENNIDEPSSSLFSENLSGTNGTKMWRPQPPLFDDDDDEDEDDDDWLK